MSRLISILTTASARRRGLARRAAGRGRGRRAHTRSRDRSVGRGCRHDRLERLVYPGGSAYDSAVRPAVQLRGQPTGSDLASVGSGDRDVARQDHHTRRDRLHRRQDHDARADPERCLFAVLRDLRSRLGEPELRRGGRPACGSAGAVPRPSDARSVLVRRPQRGGAFFHARVAGRLLDATSFQIIVIYHFDGHPYGPVPNAGESRN